MSELNQEKFWTLWREGGNAPTCKHANATEAYAESHRLCRKHPDITFWVMEFLAGSRGVVKVINVTNKVDI